MQDIKIISLSALGCADASDALLCLPKIHIDKTRAFHRLDRAPLNRPALFEPRVKAWRGLDADGNATRSPYPRSIELTLEFEDCPNVKTRLFGATGDDVAQMVNERVILEGTARQFASGHALYGASFCALTGCVEPQYVGVSGSVSGDKIRLAVQQALSLDDSLNRAAQRVSSVIPIQRALQDCAMSAHKLLNDLHTPRTLQDADRALALARSCVVQEIRHMAAAPFTAPQPCPYNIDEHLIALVKAQKETLSPDQRRALNAIRLEVNERQGARILLNGDVGTGKTLVFLLAIAAIALTSQRRVAVVVPSDLVARQIHAQATKRFPTLDPALIIAGSDSPAPASLMLVGTQALFARPECRDLEALVVDEQHKFSVDQRQILACTHTHVIEASATPIPRSLALAIFDGWKQVRIERGPVSKTIFSSIAMTEDRHKVVDLVRSNLQSGRKVIFLYPKVSGEGASVRAAGERLEKRFQGKVAVLHGQMGSEAKDQALQSFACGDRPIIAASTAVEVGVDVPDIGLMVVSGADKFGVAQLHQLRGRLARNGGRADFVMMLDKKPNKQTEQRLLAVREHANGFSLAERDMEIRGFGDVLGDLQTGKSATTFKLSRLEVSDFTNQSKQPKLEVNHPGLKAEA